MKPISPGIARHHNVMALLIAIIFIFLSCEKQKPEQTVNEFKLKGDKKAEALIAADGEFGLDLFRILAEDEDCPENMMMSPVSVAMALGMTYNGAEGTTKTAFEETLRLQGLSREEINNIHQILIEYLQKADPEVKLEIANSIWYERTFNFLPGFVNVNRENYFADVRALNFADPASVKVINDWVALKTHDKIKEVLDQIPSDAVMYLINALYFNGMWKFEFDEETSETGEFHKEEGETVNVTFMKNEASYNYFENDIFSAVELPYGNSNFVMNVFLPNQGKKITDILGVLNIQTWTSWMEGFAPRNDVILHLPKFKSEYKTLLNAPLIDMGLSEAFGDNADFSGINPDADLYISRVIHKTYIDVNEKGTEAAAVTVVEVGLTSAGPDPGKTYFIANRPFLYTIREKNTGALLFMGKVEKPEYK